MPTTIARMDNSSNYLLAPSTCC